MIYRDFRNNNKKRKISVFIVVCLFLISLIATSNGNSKVVDFGGNVLSSITTPVSKVFYFTSSKFIDGIEFIFGSKAMREENERLNKENLILKDQNSNMQKVIDNQGYLKDEYELISKKDESLIKAGVVGVDSSNLYDRFTIDKGSKDNIKVNDAVVQGVIGEDSSIVKGLLGVVTDVGYNYAKVSSITNSTKGTSFKTSRTGAIGIIKGGNNMQLNGYMYDTSADIAVGDKVYTSGLGGTYPPELYIGQVIEVNKDETKARKEIVINSPVDFTNIYRVLVFKNMREESNE
ncbi:MAG: rod shape-determining protein MreC [Lagierella massiliensis]|nr:rod shape-determining protein MreC [Lagierella massiliensis]